MKKRETFRRYATQEQRERAERDECPWCGKPKSEWKRRKDWMCCSKECGNQFHSESNARSWQQVRMAAFKRDRFTCVKCGFKPKIMTYKSIDGHVLNTEHIELTPENEDWKGQYAYRAAEHFVGDHIIPIAIGGDEWDLANVQTLCDKCNKEKTAADAGKIAAHRRAFVDGQVKLQ